MLDVTRFWYKRGVAGFRLDAVDTLFEDEKLTDNPVLPGTDKFGRPNMEEKYNKKLPEVHGVMRKLRSTANEYGSVLIEETWTSNVDELKDYYGEKNDQLQLPMDLMMTEFKGRRRNWDGEQRPEEQRGSARSYRQAGLATGKRARRRTHADAVERQCQREIQQGETVAAGSGERDQP